MPHTPCRVGSARLPRGSPPWSCSGTLDGGPKRKAVLPAEGGHSGFTPPRPRPAPGRRQAAHGHAAAEGTGASRGPPSAAAAPACSPDARLEPPHSGGPTAMTEAPPILLRPRSGGRVVAGQQSDEEPEEDDEAASSAAPRWAPPEGLREAQLEALGFTPAQLAALAAELGPMDVGQEDDIVAGVSSGEGQPTPHGPGLCSSRAAAQFGAGGGSRASTAPTQGSPGATRGGGTAGPAAGLAPTADLLLLRALKRCRLA